MKNYRYYFVVIADFCTSAQSQDESPPPPTTSKSPKRRRGSATSNKSSLLVPSTSGAVSIECTSPETSEGQFQDIRLDCEPNAAGKRSIKDLKHNRSKSTGGTISPVNSQKSNGAFIKLCSN